MIGEAKTPLIITTVIDVKVKIRLVCLSCSVHIDQTKHNVLQIIHTACMCAGVILNGYFMEATKAIAYMPLPLRP